ncbi:hypothetical protein ACFPZ0_10325 [Streptomonospora nanhaiensis]|uniref:hypothetical protein n=1 Tax=Streptomonospora nanhaiensis TaxID=1323731 RepID=UPI001C3920B4|nr:hypothetical protein [Streptomonospora nanhaiensis]MBV2364982.1 hypothetical protein [Streptomonospora nanhaiensis]MBX9389814.1 hypothetical protein [Streptomonospora nanhaiensis]
MTARWGHTPRYAQQHAAAQKVQAAHRGLVIWFGESTGHYHLMDSTGLHEYATLDRLLMAAWWRSQRPAPRGTTRKTLGLRARRGAHRAGALT